MTQILNLSHRDNKPRIRGRAVKKSGAGVITPIDLSTEVTKHEIILQNPKGDAVFFDTVITNAPGTDGEFHYDAPGELFINHPNWWKAQARYTFVDGKVQYSNPVKLFRVESTLLD
jgi:hypothetical protein